MNSSRIESIIRRTANRLGIDIRRHRPESSDSGRLSTMLAGHRVDLVIDVGANAGQFARSLREAGYADRIVSFEPLSAAHGQLLHASRADPRWEIAPRGAIGDHDGEIEIHVAANSVSSSLLEMLDRHVKAAPKSGYVATERVPLSKLDTFTSQYLSPETIPFIKIDTQGYEDRVLDGATNLLARAKGVQLELSLVPLYEGQQLHDLLCDRLRTLGFSIWGISPGFFDTVSGRMLQYDATFFRD